MSLIKREIARILLDLNAVSLRVNPPFTWASGRFSPIYCDNRLIISSPSKRVAVAEAFVDLIKKEGWDPDVIAGTATAGIPHAAFVAHLMNLPMIYIRSSSKSHGKENKIEGTLNKDQKVVLIEDLISTGKSSIAAGEGVVDAGGNLLGIAAIFSYGLPIAEERFKEAGMNFNMISDFAALMDEAKERNLLSQDEADTIAKWQIDPANWSKDRGGEG
ncbi:MAG: orotate phosphoribosyltransferase [Deltaproteobacteria bacterium]|nr:orotate phosphoribosyltransferase [Deltaproteobacteria bacterium]